MNSKSDITKYKRAFNMLFFSMLTLYISTSIVLDNWDFFDPILMFGTHVSVGFFIYGLGKNGNSKGFLVMLFLAAATQGFWLAKTIFTALHG
ncbi:hypothetical protein EYS14_20850 [Alteromonadaceae bacterium M269]|nr:hypothetical protein EYS14_20850 [Alteromonadaceae bacterium M269]